MESKVITQVKKNFRDYKIIEKFVAGIVLTGNEIKSLRSYQASISEAYIFSQQQELYITNMHIATYKYSYAINLAQSLDTKRRRKLLLKRKEISRIIRQSKAKNYTIIPLQLFFNDRGWAKLEIALAQRLKKYQVKEKIKERELKIRIDKEDF